MKYVQTILAILFGGLFLWAGTLKAINPSMFLLNVRSFDLLGDPYAAWLALALPWLEIFCGLAVITGLLRPGGLLLLNVTLVIFLAAIVHAWMRGIDIKCGCFGPGDHTAAYAELVLRDVLLLGLGTWLFYLSTGAEPEPVRRKVLY